MEQTQANPPVPALGEPPCRTVSRWKALSGWWRRLRGGPAQRRERRVLLLILCLWIFNVFDLNFTILAARIGPFEEANPLARAFVSDSHSLTAFKLLLILPASAVILFLRRRLVTEIGCWLACGAHLVLTVMWVTYYRTL